MPVRGWAGQASSWGAAGRVCGAPGGPGWEGRRECASARAATCDSHRASRLSSGLGRGSLPRDAGGLGRDDWTQTASGGRTLDPSGGLCHCQEVVRDGSWPWAASLWPLRARNLVAPGGAEGLAHKGETAWPLRI